MADEESHDSGGAGAGEGRPRPNGITRDQAHDQGREDFLANLGEAENTEDVPEAKPRKGAAGKPAAAGDEDGKPGKPKPKPTAAPAEDDEEEDDSIPEADDDDEDEPEEDESADDADDEEEDEDPDADEETKKRIAKVRKTAERNRQRQEQERANLERERTAFTREREDFQRQTASMRQAVQTFNQAVKRAEIDPVGVLIALGVKPDALAYVARQAYAHSPEAAKDPKYIEAARQAMQRREAESGYAKLASKVTELEQTIEQRDAEVAIQRDTDAFLDRVVKKGAKLAEVNPHTAKLIETNPKRALQHLAGSAIELAERLKVDPRQLKPNQVIEWHERKIRRQLKDLGIGAEVAAKDAAAGGGAASGKKKGAAPGGKTTGKTKPAEGGDLPSNPTKEQLMAELDQGLHLEGAGG